jgi:hypothetical protein
MPEASVVKGCPDKKALYILSWVGGVWGGIQEIYRAFQFNVNAYYTNDKDFVKNFFSLSIRNKSTRILASCVMET